MKRVVIGLLLVGLGMLGWGENALAQYGGRSSVGSVYYAPYRAYPQHASCATPASPSTFQLYRVEERRVWVPGRWVYASDGCGRERQVWQPAGWQIQRVRVPVKNTVTWSGGPIQKFTW